MTAQQLANRIAMSALIEFNMEDASASQQPPLPPKEVIIRFDDADPDLLVGEDDLDLIQAESESDFFSQMNLNRGHREARRSFRRWQV